MAQAKLLLPYFINKLLIQSVFSAYQIFVVITPLQHRAFAQIQTLLPYRGKL